jgi:Protein of unknown function (DUF2917)
MMSNEYALPRRAVLRIEDEPGARIHVWSGELWLTQEGDIRDHYLTAGQSFTVTCGGTALATALARSRVSVTPPRRESRAQRLVKLVAWLALARA